MIALLVLVAALDAGVLPEATPLGLDVQVAPEEVALGDLVTVKIAVDHDSRDVYSLPSFDPAPLAVPQGAPPVAVQREEVSGHARTTFRLVLADYGTLEPRVPDLALHVTGPDGERALSIRGRPLKFRSVVTEEAASTPEQAHHGPKPPVPVMVRSYLWLWLLLGLVAAAVVAVLLWRRSRRKAAPEAVALPPPEADDLALQQLSALRADAPWDRGEARLAIFRLSEIVRAYLGARLAFNALDLTSEELLAELRRRRLMGLDLASLETELRWEDLVKFARLPATPQECVKAVEEAESLVRHTRPLRAAPVPQKGAA